MLRQYDHVVSLVRQSPTKFSLTPEIICSLHMLAIEGIYSCAGKLRDGNVQIVGAPHQPPSHDKVPELVEQMCLYVDSNWHRSAVHLAAYVMWRHNWVHPFFGGNGRTSRAISYLVLCTKLGFIVPGLPTIPQQIVSRRDLYYATLRAADAQLAQTGTPDVRAMEQLLSDMLANQLYELHRSAISDGTPPNS